jgi:hypothetical protein
MSANFSSIDVIESTDIPGKDDHDLIDYVHGPTRDHVESRMAREIAAVTGAGGVPPVVPEVWESPTRVWGNPTRASTR